MKMEILHQISCIRVSFVRVCIEHTAAVAIIMQHNKALSFQTEKLMTCMH